MRTTTKQPAPDTVEIDALLKAANDAGAKASVLWVTFIGVGLYLTVAVGTTTHLQLISEGPIKLPSLGVDLPLFTFFEFGPVLWLVLHSYVLMQMALLARLLQVFLVSASTKGLDGNVQANLRVQLDKFVLTQALAGPLRRTILGAMLWITAYITLGIGPVLLLLFFQLKFLPYHDVYITYFHQIWLVSDIIILGFFWPYIRGRRLSEQPLFNDNLVRYIAICALTIKRNLGNFTHNTKHNTLVSSSKIGKTPGQTTLPSKSRGHSNIVSKRHLVYWSFSLVLVIFSVFVATAPDEPIERSEI